MNAVSIPQPARLHLNWAALGPVAALVLACAFFSTQSDRFLHLQNFALILQQVMVVGTMAIGQTLIILTAGIDLSCGAIMALANVVIAKLAVTLGWNPYLAVLAGVGLAAAIGLANGLLVTKARLPSFIVTLGTLNIAFAATQIYSGAQTITGLPGPITALGNPLMVAGAPVLWGSLVMLALYLLAWLALRETAPGRHVYAVGNSPEAARLSGISVHRVLLGVYTTAGALYGIAALLSLARTGVGDPQAGQVDNLAAITAVVLGGTSLFGGRGPVLGTLVGALIVGVFRNGLTLMGVESVYQMLITGILVLLAVATDQFVHRKG